MNLRAKTLGSKTLGRRAFLAAAMASVAAPALVRLARADTPRVLLKLHHPFSSVSSGHDKFLAPWARQVEAQSGGRIRIDIFPSMQLGGQPAQLFDQARTGFADIVWAAPSRTPGRFPRLEVFELPFVASRRALVSSKAIQDYAAANLTDELRDIHPICLSCADRGVIHANRPVQTIAEMKGLRLQVQTRYAGDAVRALGAYAVAMPSAQLPAAFTERVVDGCVDPWALVPSLRLDDLFKAHTDFAESSLSTETFVLAMNKASYDKLPADLKTVLDNNSGQVAAAMAGTMWDLQADAVANMVAQRGAPITTLMPEAVAHWRKATEPVIEAWQKRMKEQRTDGGKLLADAQAMLQKYAAEPEPQPPPTAPPQPAEPSVAAKPGQGREANADLTATPASPAPAQASQSAAAKSAPLPSAAATPPPAVPKPAPAAASPPKILDIPL